MAEIDSILLINSIDKHGQEISLNNVQIMTNGITHNPVRRSEQARLARQMLAGVRRVFVFETKNITPKLITIIGIAKRAKHERITIESE